MSQELFRFLREEFRLLRGEVENYKEAKKVYFDDIVEDALLEYPDEEFDYVNEKAEKILREVYGLT